MYRKILTAEFTAPDEMSPEAASLCRKMLEREPTDRLGYRGAAEVSHADSFIQAACCSLLTSIVCIVCLWGSCVSVLLCCLFLVACMR